MSVEHAVAELANEFERFKRIRENEHAVWNDLQQKILAQCEDNTRRLDAVEKICLDNSVRLIHLESDVTDLKEGQARLEQGQTKLEQRQTKLEQGQTKLEQGQAKLEQTQTEMQATLKLILDKLS